MSKTLNKIKCRLGLHVWEERCEAVKCMRCDNAIGWADPKIKKISYKRNSNRTYEGK